MNVTVRFATPEDSEKFASWAATNPDIPGEDIEAALRNRTTTFFVIEMDGVPVLYVPAYCALTVAYLGFNPEATRSKRLMAMEFMLKALSAFADQHGINEVVTFSKEVYPVAKWAIGHGFKVDHRNPLRFEVPSV